MILWSDLAMRASRSSVFFFLLLAVASILLVEAKGASQLVISPTTPERSVFQGDKLILCTCSSDADNVQRVMWTGPDGQQITNLTGSGSIYTEDGGFSRTEIHLMSENITHEDRGTYTCSANVDGKEESVSFMLFVHKQISFEDTPTEQFLEEGRDSTLRCDVTGDPTPRISWSAKGKQVKYYEGKYSQDPENPSYLIVHNATLEDAGHYSCKAVQVSAIMSDMYYLDIQVKVHSVPVAGPYFDPSVKRNFTVHLEEKAILPCTVRQIGNKTVSWVRMRDLNLLTVGRYTYTIDQRFESIYSAPSETWNLVIRYVQKSDAGLYECQVSTTPPKSQMFSLSVVDGAVGIVLTVPETQVVGESIDLTCEWENENYRVYTLKWYLGLHEFYRWAPRETPSRMSFPLPSAFHIDLLHSSQGRVRITNVSLEASGNYRCEIIGEAPYFKTSFGTSTMTVIGSEPASTRPRFLGAVTNYTAAVGKTAHFTCKVDNLSKHKVAWIKVGRQIVLSIQTTMVTWEPRFSVVRDDDTSWTLHINDVTRDDRGQYMCKVNTDPAISQVGYLNVVGVPANDPVASITGPHFDPLAERNFTAHLKDTVILPCIVKQIGNRTVSWLRVRDRNLLTVGMNTYASDPRFALHYSAPQETWKLVIRYVKKSDAGLYECLVSSTPPISQLFRLRVVENEVDTDSSSEEDTDSSDSEEELEVDSDTVTSSSDTFNGTDTDTDDNDALPEFSHYRSTLYFDYLLHLLKDEKTTNAFLDEAASLREEDAPDIEELTAMFREISNGVIPQYLIENNYSLMANATSYFNYSNSNQGTARTLYLGLLKDNGDVGTHSSFEYNIIRGSAGPFTYSAGTSFYIHTRYTKGHSFINFQSSILASMVFQLPNGAYISNGNFTGIGQGNAVSFSENETRKMESSTQTAGILHTAQYHSRNVLFNNQRNNGDSSSYKVETFSLTGGTNATLNFQTNIFQSKDWNFNGTFDGFLENPGNKETTEGTTQGIIEIDPIEPLSNTNLHHLFSMVRVGDDLYLP